MKTAIFLARGFEEIEALTVVDLLRRAKIICDMVSVDDEINVCGSHGIVVKADYLISEIKFEEVDCMILPGGSPGWQNLEKSQYLMKRLDEFFQKGKLVCAICGAPTILGRKGFLIDRTAVCYPSLEGELSGAYVPEEEVVRDGNLITSRGVGTAIAFSGEIIKAILGEETAEEILKSVVYKQY